MDSGEVDSPANTDVEEVVTEVAVDVLGIGRCIAAVSFCHQPALLVEGALDEGFVACFAAVFEHRPWCFQKLIDVGYTIF